LEGCAMWDWGKGTWGGRGVAFGTIPVCVRVQERAGEEGLILARKMVKLLFSVDHPAHEVSAPIAEVVAPEPAALTDSPSSTTVDQDAPAPSNSQTTPKTQSPIIPNNVKEDNHDLYVAHMNKYPFFGIPVPEVLFDQSSSTNNIHTIVHLGHHIFEHNSKWTNCNASLRKKDVMS
nr:hypothetical protein [Tanacetum cinerariifolium]